MRLREAVLPEWLKERLSVSVFVELKLLCSDFDLVADFELVLEFVYDGEPVVVLVKLERLIV